MSHIEASTHEFVNRVAGLDDTIIKIIFNPNPHGSSASQDTVLPLLNILALINAPCLFSEKNVILLLRSIQ